MTRRLAALAVVAIARVAAAQEPPPPDEPPPSPTPAPAPAPTPAPAPLAAPGEPGVTAFAPWSTARLQLELELYTQARDISRAQGGDLSELALDRGELGGRVALGKEAAAELRLEAIRSAQPGGAIGVDGDATIVRVKYAQLVGGRTFGGELRLDGAIGFVPDPWIRVLEEDYTVKPLSRTGSDRLLGWPVSDLSAQIRAAYGPVRATVTVGNGEGQQFPERNTGKTTTGVVEVVPIATHALRVTASAVARDGSIGPASVRDRRFGAAVTAVTPWLRAGGEFVRAYGFADRGDLDSTLVAGWVDARVIEHVQIAARAATLGFAGNGGRLSTFGGALAVEPWHEPGDRARGRLRVWLAVDRITASGGAMPLPGADAGNETIVMLIASALAPFALE